MSAAFPADLSLVPLSRRPLRLSEETVQRVFDTAIVASHRASVQPRASIVVVTHNNVVFTRMCVTTVIANTPSDAEYELIVVDNASTDGTVDYLRALAEKQPRLHVVENATNRGFAPAINQGLRIARGSDLVLLNNDTLVPAGWLHGLISHLADPSAGLVGPVTNSAGNEAQVDVPYTTYGGFERFAADRMRDCAGSRIEIPMLTMFCVAMRRTTYEQLGSLDERFAVGTFEDDDYSFRARQAGYTVVCAEDVLVHHFGQASFGHLVPGGEYARILAANRQRFEEKWGMAWQPHAHRSSAEYMSLASRIRQTVDQAAPADATVLVVSRGDDALLDLGQRRRGWHFPQLADRTYAGHYPADSVEAIAQLEQLHLAGAEYLLFPATSVWWLDHYAGLREHLEERYEPVLRDADTCVLYALDRRVSG
jgi:GT2 family glycosyltransferase